VSFITKWLNKAAIKSVPEETMTAVVHSGGAAMLAGYETVGSTRFPVFDG